MIIKKKKKSKGFTLIEVVAVMAILGILAAVLIPNVTGYITEARKFEVIEEARRVVIAAESINIKSPGAINEKDKIDKVIAKSGGIIKTGELEFLKESENTVEECSKIADAEKYTFTMTDDKKIESIISLKGE